MTKNSVTSYVNVNSPLEVRTLIKSFQAVTKNFSTLVFLVAACIAVVLSFIQKIGAGEAMKHFNNKSSS